MGHIKVLSTGVCCVARAYIARTRGSYMEREQERESERQSVTPHRRVKRPICRLLETQRLFH